MPLAQRIDCLRPFEAALAYVAVDHADVPPLHAAFVAP